MLKFHALLLFALVALLASCTVMDSIKAGVKQTADLVAVAKDTLAEAKATYASAKAEADTDGDGETSSDEWVKWLLAAGGVGGIGGLGALAKGAMKGAVRNAQSDGRKDAMEARLNALESGKA